MIEHHPASRNSARELIIDSFAGGGGASTGIEMALGRSPDYAINHDPEALALHAANHPETVHLQNNIYLVDPRDVVKGRPVGAAWFSPDCKHFSKAKGGKPVKRNIRDLAWVVVHWAKFAQPRVIFVENVEEFKDWGPLMEREDGSLYPDPAKAGETFRTWVRALRNLGYKVQFKELRACDYGAPTIRKRLFIIARRDGQPIVWPKPTHGAPTDPDVISGRKLPWRTAAGIIDWSLPTPSIFLTKEEGRAIGVNRPLAEATMARIAKGVKRYVLDAAKPFVVTVNHQGHHFRGQDLGEPFKTVTATRDAHGLIAPNLISVAHGYSGGRREYSMGEPLGTVTSGGISHAVVAPHLEYAQQGGGVRSAEDPAHTITASAKDQNLLVGATLVGCGGRAGQSRPRGADEPTATITAKADGCIAAVHLQRQFGASVGSDAEEPVGTVTAGGGGKTAVLAAHVTKFNTGSVGSDAEAPLPTVTCAHSETHPGGAVPLGVVAATMVQTGYGERPGQEPRALDVEKPLGTVVAGGAKHAPVAVHLTKFSENSIGEAPDEPLHTVMASAPRHGVVAAFLAQHNTDASPNPGRSAEAPVSTVTATGAQQAVVSAGMLNLRGSDRRGASIEAPINTVTGGGTHVAEVRAFLLKYYGNESEGHDILDPIGTVTTKDRFGLVMINGEPYEIADIGMRMLTPRELYRAQGFPNDYKINVEFNGKQLPKSAQIRMCGNSVCPPIAAALVRANCADMVEQSDEVAA